MAIILSLVQLALVISILQGVNGQSCDLSKYDLNADALRLKDGKAWHATIKDSDCIGDVKTGDICVVYFTVCDTLPEDVCNTTDSGMCMRIQNAAIPPVISERYELGETTDELNATSYKNDFSVDYTTNVTNPNCNGTTIVVTEFRCSADAVWASNNLDVTRHLIEFTPVLTDPCVFTAAFNYSGACVQAVPVEPTICNLLHYNALSLNDKNPWMFELSGGRCYDPVDQSSTKTCQVHVSFCNVLPNIYCSDSMFCELLADDKQYSFGQFNSNLQYQENPNGEGFVGNMLGGTVIDNCPDGLSAVIDFVCDKTAVWGSNNNITQYVVVNPNYVDCQFQLSVNYSGACGTPFTPPPPERGSPVGWILMGLFIGGVLAYFLVGSLIQLARGRRGVEVIPNFEFWKQFPILLVGGFKFVIDQVTCYSIKNIGGSSGSKVTEYDKL